MQKRLTHGLVIIQNFTWASYLERIAYLNDSDAAPEKRPAGDSRPLRESLAVTYDMPAGAGRSFDLHSRFGNIALGGWLLTGSMTLQSGPPLAWGNVIYLGGPIHFDTHQPNGLTFDTTKFNTVSSQQLEYNVRSFDTYFNNLRRDPTKNLDTSLTKRFSLGERRYLQLRFEGFNVTNRVTFGAPQLSPANAAFGQISTQANTPRRIETGLRLVW